MNNIKFHHFGLAVNEFSKALTFHKNLGYDCSDPITDLLQNVELVLCTSKKYPTVELIKPINNKSPVINYLRKNSEIIYHVCYELENIEKDVTTLFSNNRVICISEPQPAILFCNRLVGFYYVNGVGLIEVLQQ